ncbi:MAG: FkbM family methyltransferase [Deltaproteobacteria bacterium]|nr:MAG: FkbM family methyltransferase [Deltaproteobacteria bacterium]
MNDIKKMIKNSFLYGIYRNIMQEMTIRLWTRDDQRNFLLYSEFIAPGCLCFDIGANIGNRTKAFLKIGAKVIAVEPQNKCMKILEKHYGKNKNVKLIHRALGEKEGVKEMMIGSEHTLSSLSKNWVESVKNSGRFSEFSWDEKQKVSLTTLDYLIETYGSPDFIKIDVEGYEYEVLKGLTSPVKLLSLEFTPEYIDSTINCLNHLSRIGNLELNWSKNESMRMELEDWVDKDRMIKLLEGNRTQLFFGDVYARFVS